MPTQLDKDLVITTEKRNYWLAASTSILSLFCLGNSKVMAQETVKTIQVDTSNETDIAEDINNKVIRDSIISGVVADNIGPVPGASIINKATGEEVHTNINGRYSIKIVIGDTLKISYIGFENQDIIIDSYIETYDVILKGTPLQSIIKDVYGGCTSKFGGTFVGRLYHRVRYWIEGLKYKVRHILKKNAPQ